MVSTDCRLVAGDPNGGKPHCYKALCLHQCYSTTRPRVHAELLHGVQTHADRMSDHLKEVRGSHSLYILCFYEGYNKYNNRTSERV